MECLIRLIDKGPAEDCSKRGDIIAVQPANWDWSADELNNPNWIIVVVNGLLDTDRSAMLDTPNMDILPRGRFRRRNWFVDFSVLPLPGRFAFPRTRPKVNMTRAGFIFALTQKPPLV